MRFRTLPLGQADSPGQVGIGELVIYQWKLDQIEPQDEWSIDVTAEPANVTPSAVALGGRGPSEELLRFQAVAGGKTTLRLVAVSSGDIQISQLYLDISDEA